LLAALVAAACSGGVDVGAQDEVLPPPVADPTPNATPTPPPSPRPTPTPPANPDGRAVLPDGQVFETGPRMAVQTSDGQILTMLGDGTNIVPLTNPAEGRRNELPTWSVDANRLAWTSLGANGDPASLRSARFDGSSWSEIDIGGRPIYLAWDPTGTQVASLGAGTSGLLELGVANVNETGEWSVIDDGAPYWFSWSPDGEGFLVHASGFRLDFVPLEGPPQVLDQNPGLFQAPRWLDGAVELVYADREDDEQFLVVAGPEGSGRRAILSYDGYLQFSVAPDSGLIALHVIDPAFAPVPDVITAGFQPGPGADIIDPIPRSQLTLMALFGGDPFVLYPAEGEFPQSPVRAFYWSPDGSSLAWLLQQSPGDGDCASETAVYEWRFWANNTFFDGPRFTPTATFACGYVPGFDQFEQSVSFWSPDGTIFTYAGTDLVSGDRGIWNLTIGSFLGPAFMTEGDIAVWSPDAAGSAAASAA
jgi:TolB protein